MHDAAGHIRRMKQMLPSATHVTMNEEDYADLCIDLEVECILYIEEMEIVLDLGLDCGDIIVANRSYTADELYDTVPLFGIMYVESEKGATFSGHHMN